MSVNNSLWCMLMLSLVSTTIFANELTIINPSNKSSPASVVATVFKEAVPTDDINWYQAESCQDALQKFNSTENAVIAYNSSMDFAGQIKGMDCSLTVTDPSDVVVITREYFDICRNKGATKEYGDNKISVGMASMYAIKGQEIDMHKHNVNARVVPYAGSKDIVAAVINNDVDYGWIGHSVALKFKDALDCEYSTNPTDPKFLGNAKKSSFPEFRINMVIYTNTKDKEKRSMLQQAANSDKFTTFLTYAKIESVPVTKSAIESIKIFVHDMVLVWGTNGKL